MGLPAAASTLLLHAPPVPETARTTRGARRAGAVDGSALPRGPLCIVVNAGSGRDAAGERLQTLRDLLETHGLRYRVFEVHDAHQLHAVARQAVEVAEAQDGVIVGAGGDGTLNAVVQSARHSTQPLAILPQGTFNYFGRGLGISSDLGQTVAGLKDAEIVDTQIGLVNDHAFLVNASLGLYPDLLEQREADKQRYGRSRAVAFWSAARTLLGQHPCMTLQIVAQDGTTRSVRTPTLFVGNSALQLERVGIDEATAVDHGQLAAVLVREVSRSRMLGLMLRGAIGRLGAAESVDSFAFRELTVQTDQRGRRRRVKVACDGETVWLQTPLSFQVAPKPLRMLLPRKRADGDPG